MAIKKTNKKFYFTITFVLLYFTIEFISFCAYFFHYSQSINLAKLYSQRKTYLQGKIVAGEVSNFRIEDSIGTRVIHPYIGFVLDPTTKIRNITVDPIQELPEGLCAINPFGFVGDPAFPTKSPEKVIILIVGGSVSNQFNCNAGTQLITKIKKSSFYSNKEFSIIGLGVGAHHQPQQLMAVNYYLSQGGEYDILINIDGFNEIFVPFVMSQNKMHPSYPLFWNQFTSNFDNNQIRLIGRIEFLLDLKQSLMKTANFLTYSITANVIWSFLNQIIDNRISESRILLNSIADEKLQKKSFSSFGPSANFGNLNNFAINLWVKSSIQLAKISVANHTQYFHFLQPNIHVMNSKSFSKNENSIMDNLPVFIPPETTNLISANYPLLEIRGSEILAAGGYFSSLSMLFKNEKGTTYIDAGGHLTPLGNTLLADFIANAIIEKAHKK